MTNEQKWKLVNKCARQHKSGEISFNEFMSFVHAVVCEQVKIESRDGCDYVAVEVDAINGCNGCYFNTGVAGVCDGLPCCSVNRKDNRNVIFKKL